MWQGELLECDIVPLKSSTIIMKVDENGGYAFYNGTAWTCNIRATGFHIAMSAKLMSVWHNHAAVDGATVLSH